MALMDTRKVIRSTTSARKVHCARKDCRQAAAKEGFDLPPVDGRDCCVVDVLGGNVRLCSNRFCFRSTANRLQSGIVLKKILAPKESKRSSTRIDSVWELVASFLANFFIQTKSNFQPKSSAS